MFMASLKRFVCDEARCSAEGQDLKGGKVKFHFGHQSSRLNLIQAVFWTQNQQRLPSSCHLSFQSGDDGGGAHEYCYHQNRLYVDSSSEQLR